MSWVHRFCLAGLVSLATSAGLISPVGHGLAQTTSGSGQVSLGDLFGENSVVLKPDKARSLVDTLRKAKAPEPCPLGALTVFTPKGDPLFQESLALARREVVLRYLDSQGIDTSRVFVDSMVGGAKDDSMLDLKLDRERPRLKTTSVPVKGKKVRPGTQIRVTMVARDDADPRHWQTGIKTIQLVADSEGGRLIASENYAACSEPREKRVEATYVVPADPPPIVRLTALAEDHAGLTDTDSAEFPTGDWYGTITSQARGNIYNDIAKIDFSFSVAPDGTVTGRGRARMSSLPQPGPDCTYSRTISPAEFPVEIKVKRDFLGNEFEITPSKDGSTTWVHSYSGHCNNLGSRTEPGYTVPFNALANFRIGGGIRVLAQDGATNRPPPHRDADWVWTDEVVIHRVKE